MNNCVEQQFPIGALIRINHNHNCRSLGVCNGAEIIESWNISALNATSCNEYHYRSKFLVSCRDVGMVIDVVDFNNAYFYDQDPRRQPQRHHYYFIIIIKGKLTIVTRKLMKLL